jgi:hypothetical protein
MGVGYGALEELLCIVDAYEALLQPGVAAGLDVAGAVGLLYCRSQVLLHRSRTPPPAPKGDDWATHLGFKTRTSDHPTNFRDLGDNSSQGKGGGAGKGGGTAKI